MLAMKLEPVYLLPPEPDRRVKLSRRAFAAVVLGAAATGGSAGYWVRASRSEPTPPPVIHDRLHQWARVTAQGPIERLAAAGQGFSAALRLHGDDEVLRAGLLRLADYLLAHPEMDSAKVLALSLRNCIGPDWPAEYLDLRRRLEEFCKRR